MLRDICSRTLNLFQILSTQSSHSLEALASASLANLLFFITKDIELVLSLKKYWKMFQKVKNKKKGATSYPLEWLLSKKKKEEEEEEKEKNQC